MAKTGIGLKLKELRTRLQLTQSAFGKAIGLSNSMVADYEAEKIRPGYHILKKLKEAYQVDLNALIS